MDTTIRISKDELEAIHKVGRILDVMHAETVCDSHNEHTTETALLALSSVLDLVELRRTDRNDSKNI